MYYLDENNEWQEIVLEPSGDTLPIGAITQFGGETAPTNWLFCNGQAVSRETYAELFDAIGTTYGDGDGSTTFNLPDFIGRVPVGLDEEDTDFDTLGETGGSKELQEHNHTFVGSTRLGNPGSGGIGTFIGTGTTTTSFAGTGDSGNLQPYTVINFIIKAKQSIGIVGTVSEDITDTNNNAVPTCETVKDYVDNDNKNVYSTTETVIGTWLGEPLYRKVIDCGNLPNTTNKDITTGLSNVITQNIYGRAHNITTGNILTLPYVAPNAPDACIGVSIVNEKLRVTAGNDRSSWTGYIVLEYTKTTD